MIPVLYHWVKKNLYRKDEYAIARDWAFDSGDYSDWKIQFRKLLGPNMSETDKDYLVEMNYINMTLSSIRR